MNIRLKLPPWLLLSDAADHLSKETAAWFTGATILRLALHGEIQLSVHLPVPVDATRVRKEEGHYVDVGREKIDGLCDLVLEDQGRAAIESLERFLRGLSTLPVKDGVGAYVAREHGEIYQLSPTQRPVFPALSPLSQNSELVVKREALEAFLKVARQNASEEGSQKADTRPLGERERETLLIIIAALAKEAKIDVLEPYNLPLSCGPGQLLLPVPLSTALPPTALGPQAVESCQPVSWPR